MKHKSYFHFCFASNNEERRGTGGQHHTDPNHSFIKIVWETTNWTGQFGMLEALRNYISLHLLQCLRLSSLRLTFIFSDKSISTLQRANERIRLLCLQFYSHSLMNSMMKEEKTFLWLIWKRFKNKISRIVVSDIWFLFVHLIAARQVEAPISWQTLTIMLIYRYGSSRDFFRLISFSKCPKRSFRFKREKERKKIILWDFF